MNIINMILDLNKILQFFITQITVLESTVLKLQAALDKTNIVSKHVCSAVQEVLSKLISTMRNSYVTIIKLTTCDIVIDICITNLSYTLTKSSEYQIYMIRDKCFDCDQHEHTQRSCSMHSFDKIHSFLKLEAT